MVERTIRRQLIWEQLLTKVAGVLSSRKEQLIKYEVKRKVGVDFLYGRTPLRRWVSPK